MKFQSFHENMLYRARWNLLYHLVNLMKKFHFHKFNVNFNKNLYDYDDRFKYRYKNNKRYLYEKYFNKRWNE